MSINKKIVTEEQIRDIYSQDGIKGILKLFNKVECLIANSKVTELFDLCKTYNSQHYTVDTFIKSKFY